MSTPSKRAEKLINRLFLSPNKIQEQRNKDRENRQFKNMSSRLLKLRRNRSRE